MPDLCVQCRFQNPDSDAYGVSMSAGVSLVCLEGRLGPNQKWVRNPQTGELTDLEPITVCDDYESKLPPLEVKDRYHRLPVI